MNTKWIIKGFSGSFVKSENEVVAKIGQDKVEAIKAQLETAVYPQLSTTVGNLKITCVRLG